MRRRPSGAAELLALIGATPDDLEDDSPQLEPDAELRLIVSALMEVLADRRELLDKFGGDLRRRYELFRCAVEESGFGIDTTAEQKARAEKQRRLGELAEKRGNVDAAIFFYELALRSWSAIGCRRRLEWLRRHGVIDGTAGSTATGLVRHTGRSRRVLPPQEG